ncbi:MAG: hypothetical protein NVSMB31_19960 [Vulcanimicrobiaceae bacterium]
MNKFHTRVVVLGILVAMALVPFIARAATAPGALVTPSLDEVYSQLVEVKSRVLKLEAENRTLRTQMEAMATHRHSMGFRSSGDSGSISLRQLKYWLDHNECMDCSWMYRTGVSHTSEQFTGPPKP